MLNDWLVSSDSNELPRDRVPGTDRKFEWTSGALLLVGDEILWGDVGRSSRSRSRASDEASERMDALYRKSVGETLLALLRAFVSDSTVSVESLSDGWGGVERS